MKDNKPPSPDFTHLHNHSHYSILDGAMTIDRLLDTAREDNQTSIALTDHGNLFGAIEFYKKAREKNIKPIIGCEVYVAPGKRDEKIDVRSLGEGENSYHLVLLAKNEKGYRNLIKLSSIGYLEGFYYKPRVDHQVLSENHEGLIAMSACLAGEIPNRILRGEEGKALEIAGRYQEIFGKDNFFLELQNHGIKEQQVANKSLFKLRDKINGRLVATNDAHYAREKDSFAHDVLLCIQTGKNLSDKKRMRFSVNQFYLKTQEEMKKIFNEVPEAISNTRLITEMVNLELNLDNPILPDYQIPKNYTLDSYLEHLAKEGLKNRYRKIDDQILKRLDYELTVIKNMNFAGYFLIVQDFIRYAKDKSIPVGPGRGSAAGSLVSYCLGITDLDPLRYNLLFERFLNPDRIEMPDVDIDFCQDRRDEVIEYVQKKYGKDRVSQVIAFGTMKSKGAIKDVGRVMGIPYGETDRLSKLVPGEVMPVSLKDALEQSKELNAYYKKNDQTKIHIETSMAIEGLVRQPTKHAAGIVISKGPLLDYTPLYKDKDGYIVTQFEKNFLEAAGLVKMDFLGLRNLTVIDKALKLIYKHNKIKINFESDEMQSMSDEKVYKLLSTGKTSGIFQLEGSGMQELLRKAKPRSFEDIIAILALYRPGPLNSGMVDTYVKRKFGLEKVKYDHEILEPILKDTYGVIVYQEQVMLISQAIGSFTMAEADVLRKVMGKKIIEKMPEQRKKFVEGAIKKNINKNLAERIFDQCATFGEYGFNKSHSAAYAVITYRTAYLKSYYPVEYMAALISADMDNTDKVVKYINDANEMGISILPPDIEISEKDFTVKGSGVSFGLSAIKNVGQGLVDAILTARKKGGSFTTVLDFVNRINSDSLNRRSFESLISAGAFDCLGYKRRTLYEKVEILLKEGQIFQRDQATGQKLLFGESESLNSITEEVEDNYRNGEEWPEQEKLSKEKSIIGFYISGHPLDSYEKEIQKFSPIPISTLSQVQEGSVVLVAGIISDLRVTLSKRSNKNNGFFTLSDKEGKLPVVVFTTYLEGGRDKDGTIVAAARGKLKEDAIVAIEGILQVEEGDIYKLIFKKIFTFEEAKINAIKSIHLKLEENEIDPTQLKNIHSIISGHEGQKPVYLHFGRNGSKNKILQISDQLWIQPSVDLIQKLSSVVGNHNIICSYR